MQIEGQGFTIKESKFDYFFGRVTSNLQNQRRSLDNLENLKRLGIDEAAGGRERLMEIFAAGLAVPQVAEPHRSRFGTTIVRRVEVSGAEEVGAIEISYFYPGGDLSAIPEVSTIIVKIYRQED